MFAKIPNMKEDSMKLFDLKNEVHRKIFINSTSLIIAIVFFLLLSRINEISTFIGKAGSILSPFILGFGIAFVLNGPMIWFENRLYPLHLKDSTRRVIAAAIVFLLAVAFIIFSFWVIIPNLIDSIRGFLENISSYSQRIEELLISLSEKLNLDVSGVYEAINSLNLPDTISRMMSKLSTSIMSYSFDMIHVLTNTVIAIAAAFYMLMDKENLLRLGKEIVYSVFGKQRANYITLYCMDVKNVFQQYIIGNLLDSAIVGIVCWIGMLVLRIPYAPMIAFIVGVTNIIPVFGPFLGAIPVGIILFIVNPIFCLEFAVFILILQQVDGNVIKPIILGDKMGISGFWILFSVSVGGALFGIPGMLLGVPVFALIYEGFEDLLRLQLKNQKISIPRNSGMVR